MKKLIAILAVMIVLAGVVFAATGDVIQLESTVSKVTPNFKIYSLGAAVGPTTTAIDTGRDISEQDIEWYFTIKQGGSTPVVGSGTREYSKFKGSMKIIVSIGAFTAEIGGETYSNANYAIVAQGSSDGSYSAVKTEKGAGVENKLIIKYGADGTANTAIDTGAKSATFHVEYKGFKVTDEAADVIGTVIAKWDADDTLPMEGDGTAYTADVTLTYVTL